MEKELLELIENKQYAKVKETMSNMLVPDVADILDTIESKSELVKIFRLLPKDLSAEVFSYASSDTQEILVNAFTDKEIRAVLDEMYLDDTVDFLEEMPANVVNRILSKVSPEDRKEINQFLRYKEDSAGSIMTNEFLDLKSTSTVKSAINKIRKFGEELETIITIYITDAQRVIEGFVSIKELIMADEDEKVGNIMHTNIVYAHTDTDQEEIAQLFSKYSLAVLPIVDNEKRLVGIVTADDIIEVVQEEGTEDLQMVAAIAPIEDKPYLKTSVFSIWLQRIPWLCILMLSATFTGIVINSYESTLSPLLFACVPMLMGTGGNAGSQASVTAIRSIALGEVEFKDMFKVLWKEFRVSVILSITLAVVCFLKLQLIDRMMLGYDYTPMISLVICLAMVITILIAKIVGAALPILAKKLHLDPAVVASPFITTIVDVVSLLVYCNISIMILG